jgi:RimJ/RimL family protein N-acetyltransferase
MAVRLDDALAGGVVGHRPVGGLFAAPRRHIIGSALVGVVGLSDWEFETPRTRFRPSVAGDAADVHRNRSLMPFDPQRRTLATTRRLIAAMDRRPVRDAAGWQQFTVLHRDGGVFLGDIGINFDVPHNRQAEIGFAFMPEARGQGLAGEAVSAIIAELYARGRHRLVAITDGRNLATQRFLERLRFRKEAVHVRSWPEGDTWYDEIGYARLHDD